jgi:hypothetical protein
MYLEAKIMKKIAGVLVTIVVFSAISLPAYAAKAPSKTTTKTTTKTPATPAKSQVQTPAKIPISIGLRAGLGTDISGGLAIGANGNYQVDLGGIVTELGVSFYYANNTSNSTNGINNYTEKTTVFVFGGLANFLLNYMPGTGGLFFVAGAGLAGINVEWTEESPTDPSLGTPLPGGGSKQSRDGFSGGSVLNLGIGYLFENFDLRLEVPIIVVFGAPGKAPGVLPTLTLTGGIRF